MNGPNQVNPIKVKVKWLSDQRRFIHYCVNANEDDLKMTSFYSDEDTAPLHMHESLIKAVTQAKTVTKSNNLFNYIGTQCAK
jgi:hypothetical protein